MRRLPWPMAALLFGAAACGAHAGAVLKVDSVSGTASVDRLGTQVALKPGDALKERDLISVAVDGQLSLAFADHGFIELGPGSEIAVEKLPFASYADDLKTIFSLTHGYLRVVWRLPPQPGGGWPLFVYFGSQHAALGAGEYFFDTQAGLSRACVAAGQLAVLPNSGNVLQDLRPSACYRFVAGLPPGKAQRDASAWIAVRRGFNIDAPSSPEAMLAASDDRGGTPDAPPAPAQAARPVPGPARAPGKVPPARAPLKPAPKTPQTAVPPPPAAAISPAATAAPAAVAAPAAPGAPSVPAAADSAGEWVINVASYPVPDDAGRQAQQLRAAGYAATVRQAQVKGHAWFRVQISGYPSADAARAASAALQTRFAYHGLWLSKGAAAPARAP